MAACFMMRKYDATTSLRMSACLRYTAALFSSACVTVNRAVQSAKADLGFLQLSRQLLLRFANLSTHQQYAPSTRHCHTFCLAWDRCFSPCLPAFLGCCKDMHNIGRRALFFHLAVIELSALVLLVLHFLEMQLLEHVEHLSPISMAHASLQSTSPRT